MSGPLAECMQYYRKTFSRRVMLLFLFPALLPKSSNRCSFLVVSATKWLLRFAIKNSSNTERYMLATTKVANNDAIGEVSPTRGVTIRATT